MNKTYRQPLNIRVAAGLFILLVTAVFAMLFYAYRQGNTEDSSVFIILPLFFGPFYVGAWWILWKFGGHFHLSDEAITLNQPGRSTTLRYQDIIGIEEKGSQLLAHLVLHSPQNRLAVPGMTEGFSELYAIFRQKIRPLRQAEQVPFPLSLRLSFDTWRKLVGPLLAYTLFWTVLVGRMVYTAPHITLWHGLGILVAILFFTALFVAFVEGQSPWAVTFGSDVIEARYVWKGRRRWPVSDIRRIERERQVRRYRTTTWVVHPLVITFANGDRLHVEEGRIWEFGFAPERLLAVLWRQYKR